MLTREACLGVRLFPILCAYLSWIGTLSGLKPWLGRACRFCDANVLASFSAAMPSIVICVQVPTLLISVLKQLNTYRPTLLRIF